jgi:hypothetical protein
LDKREEGATEPTEDKEAVEETLSYESKGEKKHVEETNRVTERLTN